VTIDSVCPLQYSSEGGVRKERQEKKEEEQVSIPSILVNVSNRSLHTVDNLKRHYQVTVLVAEVLDTSCSQLQSNTFLAPATVTHDQSQHKGEDGE
jgi:hypothetical protein